MKFTIYSTSDWRTRLQDGPPTPPAKGATRTTVMVPRFGGGEIEKEAWEVEVPDLAALVKMARQEGEIIITAPGPKGYDGELEIYDDYRE